MYGVLLLSLRLYYDVEGRRVFVKLSTSSILRSTKGKLYIRANEPYKHVSTVSSVVERSIAVRMVTRSNRVQCCFFENFFLTFFFAYANQCTRVKAIFESFDA